MDDTERRNMLISLANLAAYIESGGDVELFMPAPRGRKGLDRSSSRIVQLTIHEPARYDVFCWKRMVERHARGDR